MQVVKEKKVVYRLHKPKKPVKNQPLEDQGYFVSQQNSYLTHSVRLADAKAGALLAVCGLILPNTLYLLSSEFLYQRIIYLVALVLLIASLIISFLVVLPRSKQSDAKGLVYWNHVANYTQQEFIERVMKNDASLFVEEWLKSNYVQAHILSNKFNKLEKSFYCALIGGCLILLSLVLPYLVDAFM